MAGVLPLLTVLALAPQQSTERISLDNAGLEVSSNSEGPAIAADGALVAFQSAAEDLVAGDVNQKRDIFLRDRTVGSTELVSVATSGAQGGDDSMTPAISADGRYVAFASLATEFAAGDINGTWDVFVRDRVAGTTARVSQSAAGTVANDYAWTPAISADGAFIAFESAASNLVDGDYNDLPDVFVVERATGIVTRVSVDSSGEEADGASRLPRLSADGRWVVFESRASNLVFGDDNGQTDVFVHDRQTGATRRVSLADDGSQADGPNARPTISADGRFVAFSSTAGNLVAGDTNGRSDVFVRDRQAATTTRVSVTSGGVQADDYNLFGTISADGRFVAFQSASFLLAPDTVNGYLDVFVHDRSTGVTARCSSNSLGVEANGWSGGPAISADGRYVGYFSYADNLVGADSNDRADVFLRDRGPQSDALTLTGPSTAQTGNTVTLDFSGAPAQQPWWLYRGTNLNGSTVAGHPLDLGNPIELARGQTDPSGKGSFTSIPLPASLAGLTFYLEVLARDAVGRRYDSNAHRIDIQ